MFFILSYFVHSLSTRLSSGILTLTDAIKLGNIQRNFAILCYNRLIQSSSLIIMDQC
jgi:hypothetical protein